MFLLFHDIGMPPLWILLIILIIIVFCFLLTIRGFYVLFTQTPKQTFIYLATIFGIFSIILITFLITKSDLLQIVSICFGLPFGFLAGLPLMLFINPPEPLIYLGATILNLLCFCSVIAFVEKLITKRRLS